MLNIIPSCLTTHTSVSNTLTYKIEVSNLSNKVIEDVTIKSLLSQELKFILQSVKINDTPFSYENIISGINVGTLIENETKIITFEATVINKITEEIKVNFTAEFKYKEDDGYYSDSLITEDVLVFVKNPSISISKNADKNDARLDDIITYEVFITNDGDLDLQNIMLFDNMSKSIEIIDGTFCINGKIVNSVELEKGILLGELKRNESIKVKYKTKVISGASGGRILNSSKVNYSYLLENGHKEQKESSEVNVKIKMAISNFKQLSLSEYLFVSPEKTPIYEINDLNATIKIDSQTLIKTTTGISKEGYKLNGYKLILHGTLNQTVEYVGDNESQSINSLYYETPFSTYIILPEEFVVGTRIEVVGSVEDVYFKKVDERCFFRNIELLVIAKFSLR